MFLYPAFQVCEKYIQSTPDYSSPYELELPAISNQNRFSNSLDAYKKLERIQIPKFPGDTKEYQSLWAAFSICVDETNLSVQFIMSRLESCLEEEAAETVKGLGFSDLAYEAAKASLNRKNGENRRKVQAHIEELRKMRPINADNPRDLKRFADIVERTVVSLKENKKFADLEGGILYATGLEKLPQALLRQYYRWIKEKGNIESLDMLRERRET